MAKVSNTSPTQYVILQHLKKNTTSTLHQKTMGGGVNKTQSPGTSKKNLVLLKTNKHLLIYVI